MEFQAFRTLWRMTTWEWSSDIAHLPGCIPTWATPGGGPAPLTAAFYEQFAHRSVCRLQFYAQEALTDIEMAQCVNV